MTVVCAVCTCIISCAGFYCQLVEAFKTDLMSLFLGRDLSSVLTEIVMVFALIC
jgi:hypothetical protein